MDSTSIRQEAQMPPSSTVDRICGYASFHVQVYTAVAFAPSETGYKSAGGKFPEQTETEYDHIPISLLSDEYFPPSAWQILKELPSVPSSGILYRNRSHMPK